MTVGIAHGDARAICARFVRRSWPGRCARRCGWTTSRAMAMVNQRFVDVHAPNQNLVGRTLEMVQSGAGATYTIIGILGTMAEDGPAVSPVPFAYACSPGRLVAGPRVRRAHRRRPGAGRRSAPDRQQDRCKARDLRAASARRRRRRRVRSAEARRGDAELVRERRARACRHRPLQPVHAGRVGSDARDCGPARDRRLAEPK